MRTIAPTRRSALLPFVACLAVAALPACQTGGGGGDAAEEVVEDYAPRMGMTQEEIKAEYGGEPDIVTDRAAGGAVWKYHTNMGERFIPFNFGYRDRYDTITFDASGVVVDFTKER
ncbi:hypothetical protein [Phycisphaera mikurensis]|uniref:Lipoprotein SmpA/OmlA domain-containing protein n=1 Tax=Phycisphaera mikurensis (strain NBRC 102666 / KCTC 22515 / FYK2301M01) TaxID=1142394 RepID=I0ID91_PHYMF|nr:hypothetical protein [Phycisphaera mikurensis]MBB6442354.1 hypothetical protein [Phycisphaera mikurensis]BAM03229.1 hypothetical protein PSMK_10700 [Phycisphaera mikurensis NBRC 102666]